MQDLCTVIAGRAEETAVQFYLVKEGKRQRNELRAVQYHSQKLIHLNVDREFHRDSCLAMLGQTRSLDQRCLNRPRQTQRRQP